MDNLEGALTGLAAWPQETTKCRTPEDLADACVGIGYATAKGWAVYRGGNEFRITMAGRAELARRLDPHGDEK